MIKLEKISFCGIDFGNTNWHSHTNKCDICKNELKLLIEKEKELINGWSKQCGCGCGEITKYNKDYCCWHHIKGKIQTEEHKKNRIESWVHNGNSEKYSNNWKNNNPSSTPKNRKRLVDNNPAKTIEVRKKISDNNPMKIKLNIDKISETKLERYGNANYNNQEKLRETFIKRYGVDNPAKVKEMLEKRIETYTNKLSNGEYTIKNNWKCGYHININGDKEWFDSSYEKLKMVEYDEKNINWTKKHGIKIPFIKSNGINSFYVPDFLLILDSNKIIVEIKGWIKKDDILKADTAIEWCKENGYEYYFLLGKKLIVVDELTYGEKYLKIV